MTTNLRNGLHAIGDPTRLAILKRLADGPLPVVELAHGFPLTRPAISQHLRVLKDAGLVKDRHHGTQRIYHIDQAGVEALKTHFDSLWSSVLANFKTAAEGSFSASPTENKHVRNASGHTSRKRR
ncbi:MAG TPA: metalloregulator ArsR/SmtB family transcription factor [Candidatus Dormibacteraeota bacterium]|jgi:DNA-binding transcriptional ArsR family regulator|nr:metalloregulator ArsR/SmtB family transcription factor [Candidatus Dormibacteraeota bacterium]